MNRLSLLCVPLTSTNSSLFIGIYLFTLLWFTLTLRVRTHQQSRVESNPVQSDSQRRGSDSVAYVEWPPRPCVHTSRVESSLASLAESRVLIPHASFSSFRLQWSGVTEEMDVETLILWVKDHDAIYDAPRCEHRNHDHLASVWRKIAQEWSASVFCFLFWWWRCS